MAEFEIIENKYTLPLDLAKPPLTVRGGWNETLARKLGSITRFHEIPSRPLAEETSLWKEWHDQKPRTVYSLGRRASVLAVASFHRVPLATIPEASHKLEVSQYQDVDRDYLTAFLSAIHYDMREAAPVTWLELNPDGVTDTHVYGAIDYVTLPDNSGNITMVRQNKEQ